MPEPRNISCFAIVLAHAFIPCICGSLSLGGWSSMGVMCSQLELSWRIHAIAFAEPPRLCMTALH